MQLSICMSRCNLQNQNISSWDKYLINNISAALRFSDSAGRRKLRQISRIYFPFTSILASMWQRILRHRLRFLFLRGALKNFHNHNSVLAFPLLPSLLPGDVSLLLQTEPSQAQPNDKALQGLGSGSGCEAEWKINTYLWVHVVGARTKYQPYIRVCYIQGIALQGVSCPLHPFPLLPSVGHLHVSNHKISAVLHS